MNDIPQKQPLHTRALDTIDGGVDWLHDKIPVIRVASEQVGEIMRITREGAIDVTKEIGEKSAPLVGMTTEALNNIKRTIDEQTAHLPAPAAMAIKSIFKVSTAGISVALPNIAHAAGRNPIVNAREAIRNNDIPLDEINSISNVPGDIFWYGMVPGLLEYIALVAYYKIGAIGFDGERKWDDKGVSLILGVVTQIYTAIALNQGIDWPMSIQMDIYPAGFSGMAAGIGTTLSLAMVKKYFKDKKKENKKKNP